MKIIQTLKQKQWRNLMTTNKQLLENMIRRIVQEETGNLPRTTKGMTTDDQIIDFFVTHGGLKDFDPIYSSEVREVTDYLKKHITSDSWKSVLGYLKRAGTYQNALWPLTQIANTLGLDKTHTKGVLVKDLKLGLANLITNGELVIRGSRAYGNI